MPEAPGLPPISSPSSLIASCAPLLGFQPRDCVVAFIVGVPGRAGPVLMRADLPSSAGTPAWADAVVEPMLRTGGRTVHVAAWVECPDDAVRSQLATNAVMPDLAQALRRAGLDVGGVLTTNGSVWWSHGCDSPGCCPDTPVAVDPDVVSRVRAEYAYAGYAPLTSRQVLAETVARKDDPASQVASAMSSAAGIGDERTRDREIDWLTTVLMPAHAAPRSAEPLAPGEVARVHVALADIRVRDTVLRRLVVAEECCRSCRSHTVQVLAHALRCAPAGRGAPAATLTGLVAWMHGEGALASVALDRAWEEDSHYSLAALARRIIPSGIDPRAWRGAIAALSEDECRNRVGSPRPTHSAAGRRTSAADMAPPEGQAS